MFDNNVDFLSFLKSAFPSLKSSVTYTSRIINKSGSFTAVIFFKTEPDNAVKKDLQEFLLRIPGIDKVIIRSSDRYPLTDMLILSTIKRKQPLNFDELSKTLKSFDTIFTDKDLNLSLDKLRKQNMIWRSKEGIYAVTEEALALIPHGNRRNSTDITRLLELGKRKW